MDNPTIDMKVTLELKNVSPEIASVVDRIMLGDIQFVPALNVKSDTASQPAGQVASTTEQGKRTPRVYGERTSKCFTCGKQFTYLCKGRPRQHCDECKSPSHKKNTPKPPPTFGAKGATPGIDQKAAANLSKHHLGAKLRTATED